MTFHPDDQPSPPHWAEVLLTASLRSRDAETVVGDLLEEYREHVLVTRGRESADLWYVRQAIGRAVRDARTPALLLAFAFLGRTALDWRLTPESFATRSAITTALAVGLFFITGLRAGTRSGSLSSGAMVGAIVSALAVPIQLLGATLLLASWHDVATFEAIRASGGLEEVFTSPFLIAVPAAIIASIGGAVGCAGRRLRAPTH